VPAPADAPGGSGFRRRTKDPGANWECHETQYLKVIKLTAI
jgi:hypothetical protein